MIFHSYVSLPEGSHNQSQSGRQTNVGFHKWGTPIARWFTLENPIYKWMMTGGTPKFMETPKCLFRPGHGQGIEFTIDSELQ